VSHAFLAGQLDATCSESVELCRNGECHRFPGCRQAANGQCGYWLTEDQTSQGEDIFDWVPDLGCVPPSWVVGGVLNGGTIGDASLGDDASVAHGTDASEPANDAGCDVGCMPLSTGGIGQCANAEVEWICEGNHDLAAFNANCETVPVNSIRYCCPESFLAQCQ
jgi:hypothetical protein